MTRLFMAQQLARRIPSAGPFPCAAAVVIAVLVASCSRPAPPPTAEVPLYGNLGSHHTPITATPEAAKYFDQGLTLAYAFNHAEAIRSFRQALALDPACAMCAWGVAYALGPNINAPITPEAAAEAYTAIQQARSLAGRVTDRERGFIEALARRYAADPNAARPSLDAAYAEAMRALVTRVPDDQDAQTLFAQSLMDTSPWSYWNQDGSPKPLTPEVLGALEAVLTRNPQHIGAIHLYIHAVEASPNPGRAMQYADRLAELSPGAGHLVHMPSHIYLRTGRLRDASTANENALKVDEAYIAQKNRAAGNMTYEVGYFPHNPHFLVASAMLEGREDVGLGAAQRVRSMMPEHMLHDPAMTGMVQHMRLALLFAHVRFANWDEVLAEPEPAQDLIYERAMRHAARAMAYTARGELDRAEVENRALDPLAANAALKTMYISSVTTADRTAAIAQEVVAGQIAVKRRQAAEAVRRLARAVELEDGLTYMEPPDWPIPARQLQGEALLELGRGREAEQAFRQDLVKFPANAWSEAGLKRIR